MASKASPLTPLSPLHAVPHSPQHTAPGVRAGVGSRGPAREVAVADGAGHTPGARSALHIFVMLSAWSSPSRLVSTLTGPNPQLTEQNSAGEIPDLCLTNELFSVQPILLPGGSRHKARALSCHLASRSPGWSLYRTPMYYFLKEEDKEEWVTAPALHIRHENKASGTKYILNQFYDANSFPLGSICSLIHHSFTYQVLSTLPPRFF